MNKVKAIICDLDGTLCLFKHHRGPYDASKCSDDLPNKVVISILKRFQRTHTLIFVSERSSEYREQTEGWIYKHVKPKNRCRLFMREEGDNRRDSIVKQEIFDNYIKGDYDIFFVLDDRNQVVDMWRSNGFVC